MNAEKIFVVYKNKELMKGPSEYIQMQINFKNADRGSSVGKQLATNWTVG
jgi:hypothetical protein